mmetsp:Transcript_8977/g.16570  ORF Transcript_8977/g.16570 Transcript_8977/m.16570 type:complete len:392 (+) Transcript_8977:119-1294(+)
MEGGFVPLHVVARLPSPAFDGWERLVDELPRLNLTGGLPGAVEALPLIDYEEVLNGDCALQKRAFVVLAMLIHSYIHGHEFPWQDSPQMEGVPFRPWPSASPPHVVPVQLAKPFAFVCEKLGLPMIMTSTASDLWNWKRVDGKRTLSNVKDMLPISRMTLEPAETYFHLIPGAMSHAAGRQGIVFDLFDIDKTIEANDLVRAGNILDCLSGLFREFTEIFSTIHQLVPVESFLRYRLLLQGHEIEFDLGDKREKVSCVGVSAGQTSMIVLFDIALGIDHKFSALEYHTEMLKYLPGKHRKLLLDFKAKITHSGSLRELAVYPLVNPKYEACISAYQSWRKYHLAVVSRYLRALSKGTGGSDFRDLLKQNIADTAASSMVSSSSKKTDLVIK